MNIAEDDTFHIPDFCRIDAETRRKAWEGVPLTTTHSSAADERQRTMRAAIDAERKAKRDASLARFREQHVGERFNKVLGCWERDEKALAAHHAKLEADFERECSQQETAQ